MNFEKVREVLTSLEKHEVEYIVIGGAALNLLGISRFTEDLDIFVAPTEENIARMRNALHEVFDDPHIDEITAEDLLGDYPAIQYVPPEGEFYLDILTRLGEAFAYDDLVAQVTELDGLRVSIATPETLFEMKRDTVRPRDRADAEALARIFSIHVDD